MNDPSEAPVLPAAPAGPYYPAAAWTPPVYPVWPKVIAAFVAGALVSAFSVIQIAPRDSQRAATLSAAGDSFVTDDGVVVDDAGVPLSEEAAAAGTETVTDASGRTVRRVVGGAGATSAAAGAAAPSGAAPKAGVPKTGTPGAPATGGTGGTAGREAGAAAGGATTGGGTTGGGTGTSGGGGGPAECKAGRNGGVTDTGVTATEIKIAATVVKDGPGKSLLESSETGMRAVVNKVNAGGGICGRRLALTTVNDGWDPSRGRDFIKRFIDDGNFALPVVPSSEGLSEAIRSGLIKDSGIPVVGTNGLRIDQYNDPFVFPVGSATVSIMRAMAKYAYEVKGARNFGIVWDNKYKFGKEGADAFKEYVNSLDGASIKADQPLDPLASSFGNEAQNFNTACGNSGSASGCDMVVLLLVPDTAGKWKAANPGTGAGRGRLTYGAQTLFTDDFGRTCAAWCSGMVVWTGYNPPIPPLDSKAGVSTFVNDVRAISPSIDYRNQFLQGAYLGMQVFVDAVTACSPSLTRACVNARLESTDFATDLSSTLSWRPGKHHANKAAQAFSIDATGGSFNGWRFEQTGFVQDPKL